MSLPRLTPLSIVLPPRDPLSLVLSHPWTSILLLAVVVVLCWWVFRLYINRLSTVSGIVQVDGELLPNFKINACHGTAPSFTWQLQQDCTKGVHVVYGVPLGELTVEFTWGPSDSCRVKATLDVKKGANLFDVTVSLELDDFKVNRTVAANTASAIVSWSFQKPTGSPAPVGFETTAIKFIYVISHDYKDKTGQAYSFPGSEAAWPVAALPAAGSPWTVQDTLPGYPSSNETEAWSIEVWVDGFRETKKTRKERK